MSASSPFAGLTFAEDLLAFEDAPPPHPRPRPDAAALEALSEEAGFPSREPRPRDAGPTRQPGRPRQPEQAPSSPAGDARRSSAGAGGAAQRGAGFLEPPPAPSKRGREAQFDARLTLRVTAEDKQRFDDLAYALRAPNGEAFRQLLDHFEAERRGAARGR
jgi:hypothetical protein